MNGSRPIQLLRSVLRVLAAVTVFGACLVSGLAPMLATFMKIAALLLLGWGLYLVHVSQTVQFRYGKIAFACGLAIIWIAGLHLFLCWLARAVGGRRWLIQWTAGFVGIFLFMLLSTMAVMGMAHQAAWIAHSHTTFEPYRSWSPVGKIKCAANLKNFGLAIADYASKHAGHFPDDMPMLMKAEELNPYLKDCPAAEESSNSPSTSSVVKTDCGLVTASTCGSYIYFGKGMTDPVQPTRIIMTERWENHFGRGVNVLYADGHVEWLDAEHAAAVLPGLGFERIEPGETRKAAE